MLLGCTAAAAKEGDKEETPALADPAESAYLTRDYIFVDSSAIESYLSGLMRQLLIAKGAKLEVPDILIRSSDAFDIFTDARDNIVITTELLRQVGSEDELTAALGHELSHQIFKHPQRKDAARAFPLGLETVSMIKTAASRSQGSRSAYTGTLNNMGEESLAGTQAASLIWSDLLAPAWNRKQERAADQNGFELMRAAGYDPSAFGALFQKLHDAAGKRSQRMELLKKAMLAKAHANKPAASAATKPGSADQIAQDMKATLSEGAAEGIITGLASFNRDYDTADERQLQLANYAREHREKQLPTVKPTRRFKEVLRTGSGARLLAADAAAIRTLNALSTHDMATADKNVKIAFPIPSGSRVPSPHLNFAIGAWNHVHGRPKTGEQYARLWLAARRPPAQAYVWVAYYQATRRELSAAIGTLEQGRRRVGSAAPFLPHLVSLARAAGQNDKAEAYALECLKEDQKNTGNMIANMVRGQQVPSGLYADCVQRLGHEPQAGKDQNAALQVLKKPVEASKSLAERMREKLHRDKPE